jgi:hypothetical protein
VVVYGVSQLFHVPNRKTGFMRDGGTRPTAKNQVGFDTEQAQSFERTDTENGPGGARNADD